MMTNPDSTTAPPAAEHGKRWLYLAWQKLTLPVYVLSVTREAARHCPHDIVVGSTRWLSEKEILRLARMELYPRTVGPDAYLLPPHHYWRILKLRRVFRLNDQPAMPLEANKQKAC